MGDLIFILSSCHTVALSPSLWSSHTGPGAPWSCWSTDPCLLEEPPDITADSRRKGYCTLPQQRLKHAENWHFQNSTQEEEAAARTAVFSAAGQIAKATLIKPDRTAWSIWQLPSSIRSESGCSSVGRWCLPAGSWPGNYCGGTSRPILSCAGEGRQRTRRFMSFSAQIGRGIPSNVSSGCKPGGWSSELGQEFMAHPHKKILTCTRGRLTEAVSKCCCQEILLLGQTQTQPQGGDVNNQPLEWN